MIASIVDWKALGEVALVSLVGGVGITGVFALSLWSWVRSIDLRRAGNNGLALLVGSVAVLTLAVFSAAVTYGLIVMTQK